jgi:hypothetical protein
LKKTVIDLCDLARGTLSAVKAQADEKRIELK